MVSVRRTVSGIVRPMKPCITTCPAKVPTLDEAKPEASSAMAKANAAGRSRTTARPAWMPASLSVPVMPEPKNNRAATVSMTRLINPATLSAITVSARWTRSARRRTAGSVAASPRDVVRAECR